MNNKLFSKMSVAAILSAVTLASCSEEQTLPVGEGRIFLSTSVNSDVKVVSRAVADLEASTIIWISNAEGVVRKYNGMSEVPVSGVKLLAGDYTIKAWAGKLEYASFESRWFEGQESLTLGASDSKSVVVECKIANVVTSLKYADGLGELISDPSVTISHKGGSLTFDGGFEESRKGYFMMPEGVTTLDYVLTATFEGNPFEVRGTISDVQPAHEYVLNIQTKATEEVTTGGGFITIEVDDTMVEVTDKVEITTPPAITGYGFDINAPVAGESGSVGRKSVYVSAGSELKKVAVEGVVGADPIDLIRANAEELESLETLGVYHEVENVEGGQMIKIIFDETYTNNLPNSETPYVITITATDSSDKSTTARLQLRITEAPVLTNPVASGSVGAQSAVLEGQIAKDGVTDAGFQYRVKGSGDDWTYVAGQGSRAAWTKGQTYYATLKGLADGTAYEYRAVNGTADNVLYFADVVSFKTETLPQIPNAGMEQWGQDGKAVIPSLSSANQFWDSGNHGSATMNKNITNSTASHVHGGSAAAELKSQFVGVGSIGKFAAGNIFFGKYLKTEGTDGVIGFGRPFEYPADVKVAALKVWVKYTPRAVQGNAKNSTYLKEGDMDQGHIFVALFDVPDNGDSESAYNGQYGKVVRTKKSAQLFDKNADNVVAYGEHIFTSATSGDGLIELTIPLEYRKSNAPKLLAIVCTASRYGDYFNGGEGSTMIVDDFELVYEPI